MGKIQLVTKEQKNILDEIGKNDFLSSNFYFTGGTALSSFYLGHRYSEDLDFFSKDRFDPQIVEGIIEGLSKKYSFTFKSRFVEVVYKFDLIFNNSSTLKIDFAYYPYRQIEKPQLVNNLKIDSLLDIAVNKLFTISQRNDIKDFVDLFYLLKKFSLRDLREGVRLKFKMEIEPLLLASDFLKIEDFDYLPRMIKPITIEELQIFYREQAKKLGQHSTE